MTDIAPAGQILILTGPPGSGKTTAAARLAGDWPTPAVHLHADDFWTAIKAGFVDPMLPESHAQNAAVMDALSRSAEAFAVGGYFVVVDGIIGPWFLSPFRALATPLHYVVLRPTLDVALRRVRERGHPPNASGPTVGLHAQFAQLGDLERHVIETTEATPTEACAAVQRAVDGGAFRLG